MLKWIAWVGLGAFLLFGLTAQGRCDEEGAATGRWCMNPTGPPLAGR
jgi:hypothetical protein